MTNHRTSASHTGTPTDGGLASVPATQTPDGTPATHAPDGTPATETPPPSTPADRGLAAELESAAPRRWWNRGTVALTALLLGGGGFLAGAYTQQQYGQPAAGQEQPARGGTGAAAGARGGQFPGGFAPGTGQNPAAATPAPGASASAGTAGTTGTAGATGTVKLVDGTTVYVETADGTVITVRITDSTAIRTTRKATVGDLKAGAPVTIEGTPGEPNTLTATTLTTTP